jgi:hypothetical protein
MKKQILCIVVAAMATVSFAGGMYYGTSNSRGMGTQFKFGRVELRMKTQPQSGVITGFIMISPDDTRASNKWCEWDIEITGGYPNVLEHTTHVYNNQTYPENRVFCTGRAYLPDDATSSDRFYTYAGEWTPEYITFECDGFVFRKLENTGNNSYTDTRWDIQTHEIIDKWDHAEYQVEKNNGPESLIDVWAGVEMMCGFDTWHCAGEDWCVGWAGGYPGDDPGKAFFMNYFRYYSYTPKAGPDGSDFTLVTDENYDAANPAEFNQYGCEFRNGYAISSFGGSYTGEIPVDNDTVGIISKAYALNTKLKRGAAWITNSGNTITYSLLMSGEAVLGVYDLNGKLIRNLFKGYCQAGQHSILINSESFASGTYLISLTTANAKASGIMTATR